MCECWPEEGWSALFVGLELGTELPMELAELPHHPAETHHFGRKRTIFNISSWI